MSRIIVFCRSYLILVLVFLVSPTLAASQVSYHKIKRLYASGKYQKVLEEIKEHESSRFDKNHRLKYSLRNDILYYHFKLSAMVQLNHPGSFKESVGLYKRLVTLDTSGIYLQQPHYLKFKESIGNAAEKAHAQNDLVNSRFYVNVLALTGDTSRVYYSVYPKKENLYLATEAALREFLKNYDYTEIDKKALATKKQLSIENQAWALTKNYGYDFEKVRAIYIWIVNNISYDYSYTIYSASLTFEHNRGVCSGFSYLFQKMCQSAGIKSFRVTGFALGDPPGPHAWNAIEIEGRLFLIESTWASCIKSKTEYYYLIEEKELAKTHKKEQLF